MVGSKIKKNLRRQKENKKKFENLIVVENQYVFNARKPKTRNNYNLKVCFFLVIFAEETGDDGVSSRYIEQDQK